ncbi:hypothetical protein NQ317_011285 [Molorchus minor]|uniref:Ankyrin 2 n=1 Tax=Molorchus minor TaxID=1323400 RepID=A0ABQ9JW27_9CUCU|nr:hypothetical protein NQ317_011285 [Molorchus minor]
MKCHNTKGSKLTTTDLLDPDYFADNGAVKEKALLLVVVIEGDNANSFKVLFKTESISHYPLTNQFWFQNGLNALHLASKDGHVDIVAELLKRGAIEEVVKLLVQHGASVNVQSQNGFTPLYMAAQENHDNVVRYLLANGANQSLSTEDGFTPLAVAMQQGHDKVVTVLLENDTRGKIRLPALHIAAKKDDVKAAKLLLENDHNPDVTSKSGFTPLHIASHYGNQQIGNLLIQKGADVNYAAKHNITPSTWPPNGVKPIWWLSSRSGHEQVVDMLLERGAPISSKTKNGLAPLHMAAQGDHVDAARILLYHRAPVDEVTVDYLTALHVAAHCGHVRVAKLLLDRQADANARALNGFTPLHIACKKNRIKSGGVAVEAWRQRKSQRTANPLHIASRLGNVDIVMLLLQHGAKVDNTTKDMYTSLHIAAKEGQDEVAAVLLDNGASLDATTKKEGSTSRRSGQNGVTPLHVASHYDHQNVALLLLDKGASPHATAKNGHTPLHIAARKNQMDIANTLLEYGAQPNAESKAGFTPCTSARRRDMRIWRNYCSRIKPILIPRQRQNGLTPLHLCAQEDRVPVAEILVKNGANTNAATNGGYTPLHIASHYGQTNMVKFLLQSGANVKSTTSLDYTPLHQAAQQGHANIVNILLENDADPNAVTTTGQTPLNIAQKLGYITVIETLKVVTTTTTITTTTTTTIEEKYKVQAPELMHETFMSDSEEEGGEDILEGFGTALHERHVYLPYFNGTALVNREDTVLGDQTYRYLTADEMKSLGDDSLPIDVTRDERIDSNRMVSSADSNQLPPQHIEDSISPEHVSHNYVEYIKKYASDNVDIGHPISIGFLVSFLVDARGGAMRGCRHSGVRVIVPPRCAPSPTRITCRYVRPQRTPHPPPLMEGEALASRVLELGPVGAKFLGPVIIEVPHFAALRGKEREIVILRSDNGESWKEHTVDASEDILNEVLHDSFEAEGFGKRKHCPNFIAISFLRNHSLLDLNQLEDISSGRITRIVTQDFPQYFAVVSRIRQEVHAIGPEGGMVSSTVVPQVQAVFPEGALTKKIKVGLQAQPIDPELTAKLLGHGVAVSPVVTVEPRRRKFHKAITLSMPAPTAHSQGMINQYSGSAPTLRLLCSITGGTTRAQWEDVTGSTPLTFVNDCVSFTTTVSARFWLMDCRNIGDATKMATELYKEAIHVPFMAKFVVFAKRVDPLEARLRVFCMTDDKEDKTLEHQEHFTEVAKSKDVEVLEGKQQYVEFVGNLVPIAKSGEQLTFSFRAFRENRLPFSVRVKDQHAEAVSRCLFMREPKVPKGEPPQHPICILNIVLPDDIVTDTISLTDSDSLKKYTFSESFDYHRPDPRIADMSNLLGEDWVPLANQLGLTTSEINVIKSEYPDSVAKQAQSMLRMWLSQSGNKAQTNTIENALRRIGREDIIPQCLNVDHGSQPIARIKQEEIGKYRLKKDIDNIDREVAAMKHIDDTKVLADKIEARKPDTYDKYSAEEKVVEKSDEEEEPFDKPVAERREQIEKRLSAERTIPASSQRREIVQEITDIKRQSIVEDKIAEVQQKATHDQKTAPEQAKTTPTITKTITISPEIKTVSETVEIKTTILPDSKVSEAVDGPIMESFKDVKTTIVTETRTILPGEDVAHRTAEDTELLQGVTLSLEKTKTPVSKLIETEDPKSPKFSKTPPPSPADFLIREQAATVQVKQHLFTINIRINSPSPPFVFFLTTASASPADDDDSLDTDGFREDQYFLETPTPGEDVTIPTKPSSDSYSNDIESQEVTTYDDIRQYYQHQLPGPRKRLASTEDLETDVIDASTNATSNLMPSNELKSETRGSVRLGLRSCKLIESDPVRPGELNVKRYISPEEKGAKDSKKPEDWERKERKTVERLHGGGGKDKIPPSEEEVHLKTTPDKKITISYTEVTKDLETKSSQSNIEKSSIGIIHKAKPIEQTGQSYYTNTETTKDTQANDIGPQTQFLKSAEKRELNQVHRSTSPLGKKDLTPTPDSSPPTVADATKPTLELIIGRKEVRTKEALATAESRLTLYGTKDVEISIKSQSHISVTTTRRDNSGTETSERFDVGMSTTAGKDKHSPENIQMTCVDKHGAYIIPPVTVLESAQKKKEETVNFSGTKQIYTYREESIEDNSQMESPDSESMSHHITDTGISLTRGTITGTNTSLLKQRQEILLGQQTTGFISDSVDAEIEELECTDAGLSPIQADELTHELEEVTQFTDAGTSPVEFPESTALSQVDTSEAATLTDQVDMKDSTCSPIKPEDLPISASEKLVDEEILEMRRGSGDVKAKIRMLEEQVSKSPHKEYFRKKREIVESEDELSSMKEEEAFRGSNETIPQLDDEEYKMESITEYKVKEQIEETYSEPTETKPKHVTPVHTKQVGRKIAELQKIFSSDVDSTDEDSYKSPIKIKLKEKVTLKDFPPEDTTTTVIKEDVKATPEKLQASKIITDEKPEQKHTVKPISPMVDGVETDEEDNSYKVNPVKRAPRKYKEESKEVKELSAIPPKEEKPKVPCADHEYTKDELIKCLADVEKQVITKDKEKSISAVIKLSTAQDTDRPCVEPICVKVHVEPKSPLPSEFARLSEIPVSDASKKGGEDQTEAAKLITLLPDHMEKLITDQTKILEEISGTKLEIDELPCIKHTTRPLTPAISTDSDEEGERTETESLEGSEIIKEALVAHAKLVSSIALPAEVAESEKLASLISPSPKETEPSSDKYQLDYIEGRVPTTEQELRKIMCEVLEASKKIREDVKELKPDLTPTPEGQLITLLPSASLDEEEAKKLLEKECFDITSIMKLKKELDNKKSSATAIKLKLADDKHKSIKESKAEEFGDTEQKKEITKLPKDVEYLKEKSERIITDAIKETTVAKPPEKGVDKLVEILRGCPRRYEWNTRAD